MSVPPGGCGVRGQPVLSRGFDFARPEASASSPRSLHRSRRRLVVARDLHKRYLRTAGHRPCVAADKKVHGDAHRFVGLAEAR